MVCVSNDTTIPGTLEVRIPTVLEPSGTIDLWPTKLVKIVFLEVAELIKSEGDSLKLTIVNEDHSQRIELNKFKEKMLMEAGVSFAPSIRSHTIVVDTLSKYPTENVEPENVEVLPLMKIKKTKNMRMAIMPPPPHMSTASAPSSSTTSGEWSPINYVGLVNQAMTCYLNSLLQALYMTPEFRNALYNWEFDGKNPATSIPFQLQRLFLNLQTSTKSAVETTDLTQSFGWNVQQAWEQHDIQELCRVMFDALEQKFKDTKQANLINDLYEGKMLDYVTCLECRTEKSREDTFQDIPLPVRPFGSAVAYNSVEEALRAFVQPETLDGNNQYFCEKCNKKCDAHKGLKFTKFPYLLTLHLKRFDFDYNTGNRIKLNDKVVFPEALNLNSFIPHSSPSGVHEEAMDEREGIIKSDDCSTTDSGSALDDEGCQGAELPSTVNGQEDACPDDDEGIDVSSGNNHQENEKNRLHEIQGPYIYELFSIMIHSGSASGGHYYAYIKDFSKNQWFCFNDQSVTSVTNEDIHKTYGGGPQRGYYSGAYSSSTNAYMLMYRQIDKERNCEGYTVDEFPAHIQQLLKDMRESEESARKKMEEEVDSVVVKVHCFHPEKQVFEDRHIFSFLEAAVEETAEDARIKFKLHDVKPEDCRLVAYTNGSIECSFEPSVTIGEVSNFYDEYLLEIKKPGTEFDVYKSGGVMMRTFIVNIETEEVDGPDNIWVNQGDTVRDLRKMFAVRYNMETVHIVQEIYSNQPHYLKDSNAIVHYTPKSNGYKLYVSSALNSDDSDRPYAQSTLASIIDRFVYVIMLNVSMPDYDTNKLDILSIPALDTIQCTDGVEMAAGDNREQSNQSASLRVSPQPSANSELFGDQSNSEDSSLSDSDRTLVGDAPGDNLALLSSSSNSPADQHMASPTDGQEDEEYPTSLLPQEETHWWDHNDSTVSAWNERLTNINYYFKAQIIPAKNDAETVKNEDATKTCKVLVDKRMTLGMLKKNLEPIVGVPMEYFKIFRPYPHQDHEWSSLKDTLGSMKDDDRLVVKLGRVLKDDEYSLKVFHLDMNASEPSQFLFEYVVGREQLVSLAKKEILLQAKKQNMIDIPYSRCRLRRKSTKAPERVLMDDEKFIEVSPISEVYLQEIEGPERTSAQVLAFVRQWYPSKLSLSSFREVVLESRTKDELKSAISAISDIPEEFLEVARIKSTFPCDTNVLDIHTKCNWNFEEQDLSSYPINVYDDGSIFYYRDSRETLKDLTQEERIELFQSECQRLGHIPKLKPRRRERGLKIYVDTSPKKEEDNNSLSLGPNKYFNYQ